MQIGNMDKIYSYAQLTIIAASGSDPNYGLPGVGKRSRIPMKQIRLGEMVLVESILAGEPIGLYPWAHRGW